MMVAAGILGLHHLVVEVLIHLSLAIVLLILSRISNWFLFLHGRFGLAVKPKLLLWFCIGIVVIVRTNILSHPRVCLIVLVALADVIDFVARVIPKVV